MDKEIKRIEFPNNVHSEDIVTYTVRKDEHINRVSEIRRIEKREGEMSYIGWFEIWKDGKVIAEIKESVCNIYF